MTKKKIPFWKQEEKQRKRMKKRKFKKQYEKLMNYKPKYEHQKSRWEYIE